MSKNNLIERWRSESLLKNSLIKLTDKIKKGGKINSEFFPAEVVEGKFDFRGVDMAQKTVKMCEFQNVDFSFSSFKNSWVENNIFENCRFSKVDFSDVSDHNNNFKGCFFSDCKFNSAAIGFGGTRFYKCILENCKFSKTIFTRPEFVEVVFKNCKIKNIDFNASSFENCSFEGELNDVWFRGSFPLKSDEEYYGYPKLNEMKNVSFENADLKDLTFSDNCDLSTVKIKQSDDYYKFDKWKERLLCLLKSSESWTEKEKKEAKIFTDTYLVHASFQQWYIVNKTDVIEEHGNELALKIINQLSHCNN